MKTPPRRYLGHLLLLTLLFFGGRLASLDQPLIEVQSGRQIDTAMIARSFYFRGDSILYPQLPVRGPRTSYLAAEFQLYPFLVAQLYEVFGPREVLGRVVSLGCGYLAFALALWSFCWRFSPPVSLLAGLLWCASPLLITFNQTFQPDSLLLLFMLVAWVALEAFERRGGFVTFGVFLAAMAVALLIKLPAGMLFFPALWVFFRSPERGDIRWGLVRSLGLGGTLVPSLLWYRHTATYGADGISWGVFEHLNFAETVVFWFRLDWWGDIALDWLLRLGPPGAVVFVGIGVVAALRRRTEQPVLLWLGGLILFYLAGAWSLYRHDYYHLVGVMPFLSLAGVGMEWCFERLHAAAPTTEGGRRSPLEGQLRAVVLLVCLVTIGLQQPSLAANVLPERWTKDPWDPWNREHVEVARFIGDLAPALTAATAGQSAYLVTPSNISLYYSRIPGWVVIPDEVEVEDARHLAAQGARIFITTLPVRAPFSWRYNLPEATHTWLRETHTAVYEGDALVVYVPEDLRLVAQRLLRRLERQGASR